MNRLIPPIAAAATLVLSACVTGPVAPLPPRAVATQAEIHPWGWGYAEKAVPEMAVRFGRTSLAPGEYLWAADKPDGEPTRIVVSLTRQMAWVYQGDAMVAATTISSGSGGHESPVGEFPILGKDRFHKSNRYSAAPMPFMLRLNSFGVALHGGKLPGYPASHGCIRLPMTFAQKLFGLAKIGDTVFVEG